MAGTGRKMNSPYCDELTLTHRVSGVHVHIVHQLLLVSFRSVPGFIASLQNGTRCRDGMNVLWCHSHLVWLVFEGYIPILVFIRKTFFVTCSCCFCFNWCLEIVRKKRGG